MGVDHKNIHICLLDFAPAREDSICRSSPIDSQTQFASVENEGARVLKQNVVWPSKGGEPLLLKWSGYGSCTVQLPETSIDNHTRSRTGIPFASSGAYPRSGVNTFLSMRSIRKPSR
jgi:hypothetical protein